MTSELCRTEIVEYIVTAPTIIAARPHRQDRQHRHRAGRKRALCRVYGHNRDRITVTIDEMFFTAIMAGDENVATALAVVRAADGEGKARPSRRTNDPYAAVSRFGSRHETVRFCHSVLLSNVEMAVISWGKTKGLAIMTLPGTPCAAHSPELSPLM